MAVVLAILVLAVALFAVGDARLRRIGRSRRVARRRPGRTTAPRPTLRPDLDPVPGMYMSAVFTSLLNERRRRRNARDLAAWRDTEGDRGVS
jgi:hypothetical protein